tara:strand:- start:911 stop:1357 length:447 start_codon:yes stop_codon:yes gene_type:complete
MLDQQHNVMLHSLSARGVELSDRYRDLAGLEGLPQAMAEELRELACEREGLMAEFRQEVLSEGGMPKAGNPDREFIDSLTDRWLSRLQGLDAVFSRLQQAEQAWLDDIGLLSREEWSEPLAELLISLSFHGHRCQERLQWMADHSQRR